MKYVRLLSAFRRNHEGATAVEFAIVAVPFFMMFMGLIEFGLYMMTQVTLEAAVTKAGRVNAVTQLTGENRVQLVEAEIKKRTGGLMNSSQITFTENTVAAGGTFTPDLCFDKGLDQAPSTTIAVCPVGSAVIEGNDGNPGYQPAKANNGGTSGDLVEVRATYPWRVQLPIFSPLFGDNGIVMITSTTVIRNE